MSIRTMLVILLSVLPVQTVRAGDKENTKIEFAKVLSQSKGRINLIFGLHEGEYIFTYPKRHIPGLKRFYRSHKSMSQISKMPDQLKLKYSSLLVNAESDTVLVLSSCPHFGRTTWDLQTKSDVAVWTADTSVKNLILVLKDYYFRFREDGDVNKFKESCLQDCDDVVFGETNMVFLFVVKNGKIDGKSSYCLSMEIVPYKTDEDHPLGYEIPPDEYISEYLDKFL